MRGAKNEQDGATRRGSASCGAGTAEVLKDKEKARLADASKTARLRELRMAKIAADAKVVADEKAIAKPVAPARRKVRKPGAA